MDRVSVTGRKDDFESSVTHLERFTSYTVSGVNAVTRDEVAAINWADEVHGRDHPVAMAITPDTLYDVRTGTVMAIAQPGYRFYWFHAHPHIAPADWDGVVPCRDFNEPVKQGSR